MRLGHLLLRQWRNRPGRAIATAASVAVAVGAVVIFADLVKPLTLG